MKDQRFQAATGSEILQGALEAARMGYRVFPCNENKKPSIPGGFYAATTNPDIIRRWAAEGLLKNVAIATGLLSEVVVADADTEEAYERMCAEYGPPHVESAHSHKKGGHWWGEHPQDGKVKSTGIGGGIDIKADGGYALIPPSTRKYWTAGRPQYG